MSYCFGDPEMVRKPRPNDYSEVEVMRLRELAESGCTQTEAAQILGRSPASVRQKSLRAKIRWPRAHVTWSNAEIALLRRMAKTHTAKQVAEALHRGHPAVYKKAESLGIAFQKHGEAHHASHLSKADAMQIFALREQNWTHNQIAKRFGIHPLYACYVATFRYRYRETLPLVLGEVSK